LRGEDRTINPNWNTTVRNKWKEVIKKLKDEEKGLENISDIWKNISEEQKQIIKNLMDGSITDPQISPWNYVIKNLGNQKFEPHKYFYARDGHKKAIAKHDEMLSKLTNPHLGSFKTVLNEFKDILCTYDDNGLEDGGFIFILLKYKEDVGEIGGSPLYNRFDKYYNEEAPKDVFNGSKTILEHILNAIPRIKFLPCEVKALNMTETGDFTNTTIAGIDDKTKGILNNENTSGPGVIGLCQLPNAGDRKSADEAVKWIKDYVPTITALVLTKPVEITNDREDPRNAIFLTAGYLGRIIVMLTTGNTGTNNFWKIKDCLTKKKIVFLSYNAGFSVLVTAINKYFTQYDNEKNPLIFEDGNFIKILHAVIDSDTKKSEEKKKEQKEYVSKVVNRLNNY
jgi:hypothetical protein